MPVLTHLTTRGVEMAVYRCSRCDTLKDGDFCVCAEDPREEFGLMCEACAEDSDEIADAKSRFVREGSFTKEQLKIIAQMEEEDDDCTI